MASRELLKENLRRAEQRAADLEDEIRELRDEIEEMEEKENSIDAAYATVLAEELEERWDIFVRRMAINKKDTEFHIFYSTMMKLINEVKG